MYCIGFDISKNKLDYALINNSEESFVSLTE